MIIKILTIFPDMFSPVMDQSIVGRAVEKEILNIELVNIRDYSLNKHKKTDDTPYGGGPGMVMSPEPIFRAIEEVKGSRARKIYLSPKGRLLDKELILNLSQEEELLLLCGHYEGVDQRVLDYWEMEEISIGDYVLTGGELPAMVLIDSVARFIPGVLGSCESHIEESIYSGLLEYPQYTKPRNYMELEVPPVLTGGHHGEIDLWRFEKSLMLTGERRPDLFKAYLEKEKSLNKKEKIVIKKVQDALAEKNNEK